METERSRLLEKTIKTFDSIESGNGTTPAVDEPYTTFGAPSRYNSASTKEKLWKNNREEYLKNENDKELGNSPTNCSTLTCFLVILCLILPFLGLYLVHSFQQTLDTFDSTTLLPNGAKVQLFSPSSNFYLRVDTGESSTQATVTERKSLKLVADIPFPWLHGSSFEVFRSNNHCFQLKSMKNFWLRVDSVTGDLTADGSTWFDGEHFALQPMQENQLTGDSRIYYQLKVCNYQYYFGSYRTKPGSFAIKLTPDSMSRRKSDWFPWARQSVNSSNSKGFHTALEVKIVKPWLGVNLGGWFIPEFWMNPTFYNASGLEWASSVCTFKTKNAKLAEKTMTKHLATWITETDLRQIVKLGFNSIRLPVGYWNLINDPYDRYVPSNVNVSLHYLDWLFDITDELKLSVLVDLHGGPGSQNGADHSGCLYMQQFNQPKNIELTLQSIEIIMKRYSKRSSFLGVELLNEPSDNFIIRPSYSTLLNDYYIKAYHLIRSYHKSCYIMINELGEKQYKIYQNDLQEPNYYNVIMDYHLYNWQNPYTYQTAEQHLTNAKNWKQLIDYFNKQHPIVVGEWSMSTGVVRQVGQKFVDASAESFTKSFGWYLWSWKTERNPQFDAWDVQYQMITLGGFKGGPGLNPLKYYQEHAKYLLSN